MNLTGVHFNLWGSQVCWWWGLRIPSGERCPLTKKKHSAHRSKSCMCVFVLTWLENFYPHGHAGAATCKPLLDERYRAQIVQKCMLLVSYLCRKSLYSQTTHGWNSMKHLFTTSGSRAVWRLLLALMLVCLPVSNLPGQKPWISHICLTRMLVLTKWVWQTKKNQPHGIKWDRLNQKITHNTQKTIPLHWQKTAIIAEPVCQCMH